MALSKEDKSTLQEIIDTQGACMNTARCQKCPFKVFCLPEFLHPIRPTQPQRFEMALNVLSHHALVDEDMTKEDIESYSWKETK